MSTKELRRPRTAAARVLALMVAANGRADPSEWRALDDLQAFDRLGVPRPAFAALVDECLERVGTGLAECSWLRMRDLAFVEPMLEAVSDPAERLMVCRFAAAVLTADGQVSSDERLVFDHAMARWRISRSMLTEAIRHDGSARGGQPVGASVAHAIPI